VLIVKRMATRTFAVAVLLVAATVTGLSIAQAVRQDSLEPILVIGWLPAMLIAASYRRPSSGRSCSDRFLRRPQSQAAARRG